VVLRPYRGELTMLESRGGGAESSSGGFNDNGGNYCGGGYESAPQQSRGAAAPARSTRVDELEDEIPF
jgi:single-strand DNA-binding protein